MDAVLPNERAAALEQVTHNSDGFPAIRTEFIVHD